MPRNTLSDLNNHLFEQMERLNDDELTDDGLKKEMERSKAMSNIAETIIKNADLSLQAQRFRSVYGEKDVLPRVLELPESSDRK